MLIPKSSKIKDQHRVLGQEERLLKRVILVKALSSMNNLYMEQKKVCTD